MFKSKGPEIYGNKINPSQNLTDFTNSYQCNLFVYTIRKCLEFDAKLKKTQEVSKLIKILDDNNNEIIVDEKPKKDTFTADLIDLLFEDKCCPSTFFLVDGDFPKRNVMHYAANYNCSQIPKLILKKQQKKENEHVPESSVEDIEDVCDQVLNYLKERVCVELKETNTTNDVNGFQGNKKITSKIKS